MKITVLGIVLVGLSCITYAQEKGIKFENQLSWEQIKMKAKKENKFIFVDVFATWCGPCKKMDETVYPLEKLGAFINDKFISVKVQSDVTNSDSEFTKSWYPEAKKIVEGYQINILPTILFFSPDANLINRASGYIDASGLIVKAQESLDIKVAYCIKVKQFKQGKLSPAEQRDLANLARSLNENEIAQQVADIYIDKYLFKVKKSELFNKDNLTFIATYLGEPKSKSFELFKNHPDKVNAILGEFKAQMSIMSFINRNYLPTGNYSIIKAPDWDGLEKTISAKFGALGEEIVWAQRMLYHWVRKDDWKSFGKYYKAYFERSLRHPPRFLINNVTWEGVFEHVNDPVIIDFAIGVMKYTIENYDQNDAGSWDTYANLLYKVGRTNEAIEWEERAVKLSGQDKALIEMLQKMKKGEKTWQD